ncbi:hypothetical protein IHQ71_11820 [Rhizobium sp. TH2]|uniref:hypothetical protein n=1 Tax=Rhizobium sp. TH2 TaxID=2775403 RepID=UPI0021582885|nr:hypothetical protein [Rhizobium sp. TH2]UVC11195.1 hypothetical protein IHQ71_11820 [Rhizobium sp. TH2]
MENVLRPNFGRLTSHALIHEMSEQDPLGGLARAWYADKGNPKCQMDLSRFFDRQLRDYFDLNVYSMLRHLFDQTIQMGRDSWGFTYMRIAKGDTMTNGVGCDERTAKRLVAQLAEIGVIIKEPNPKGVQITFNLNWRPQPGQRRAYEDRKKAPTRKMGDTRVTRPVTGMSPPAVTGMSPIREEDVREEEIRGEAFYSAPASQNRVIGSSDFNFIEEVEPASPSAQEPPAPQSSSSPQVPTGTPTKELRKTHDRPTQAQQKVKPGAIEETFRAAFDDAFRDYPGAIWVGWTGKERAIVNNALIKKWERKPEDLHEFLRWAVTNWTQIMSYRFSWVKHDRPEIPTLSFLISMLAHFRKAYASDMTEGWLRSIKDHEKAEFARLTLKGGLTQEEARMKIAEKRAVSRMWEKNNAVELAASQKYHSALRMQEDAKRYGALPIHPKSQRAMEIRREASQRREQEYREEVEAELREKDALRAKYDLQERNIAEPSSSSLIEGVYDFGKVPRWEDIHG